MKRLRTVLWVSWGLGLAAGAYAQDGKGEVDPFDSAATAPRMIRVQVEWIEMSHETMTGFLAKPRKGSDDTALRKEVAELVDQGKAAMLDTMVCIARSGEKATTESIEEYIYPTEYEPAEIPSTIRVEDGKDVPGDLIHELATGPTPTAFETRNLGATLEIAPSFADTPGIIDLSFSPEIVYHVRDEVWAEWKDKRGDSSIRMPIMYKLSLNTSVTVIDGQHLMVAALSPKSEEGFPDQTRKVMIFVRCDELAVGH